MVDICKKYSTKDTEELLNTIEIIKTKEIQEEHRDNILEQNFNYTGICVIDSPIYGKVFVQLFIGI